MRPSEVERYLDRVCGHIPHRRARADVREELLTHLEEHAERLMQCGMGEADAWTRATEEMGEPEAVGNRLGAIHARDPSLDLQNARTQLWWGLFFLFFRLNIGYLAAITTSIGMLLIVTAMLKLRTCNRRLNTAFWVYLIPCTLTVAQGIGNTLPFPNTWAYLSLLLMLVSNIAVMIFLSLISNGLADLLPRKDMRKLRRCGLLYLVIEAVAWADVLLSGNTTSTNSLAFLIVLPLFIVILVRFRRANVMLCADDADTPAAYRPLTGKGKAVLALITAVALLLPIGSAWLVSNRQPTLHPYEPRDVGTDDATCARADAVRDHLLKLGFPDDVLDALPQSELLPYESAVEVESIQRDVSDLVALTGVCTLLDNGESRFPVYYEWRKPPTANTICQLSLWLPDGTCAENGSAVLLAEENGQSCAYHPFYKTDPMLGIEFAAISGKSGQRGVLTTAASLPNSQDFTYSIRFAYQSTCFRMNFQYSELQDHLSSGGIYSGERGCWQESGTIHTVYRRTNP